MAKPVPATVRQVTAAGRGLALALACASAGGCLGLERIAAGHWPAGDKVCQVVAAWNNKVIYAPDPTRNGMPCPSLMGRVFLFDQQMVWPQAGEGTLTVDLYDHTPPPPGQPPRDPSIPVERWHFDNVTLNKVMLKKDIVGWGYSVPLPWSNYRPDVKQVHLTVRYDPEEGPPVFAPGSVITIEHTPPPAGSAQYASAAKPPPPPTPPEHRPAEPHNPARLPMPRPLP